MAALLEARGLHAQYGWTKVLHGIDFGALPSTLLPGTGCFRESCAMRTAASWAIRAPIGSVT